MRPHPTRQKKILLWFMPTYMNKEAEFQFGPYAYRSNAAQYFNLLWPVVLGFWWTLRREARHRLAASKRSAAGRLELQNLKRKPRAPLWRPDFFLLPCVMLMAVCPIISARRVGAVGAFIALGAAAAILLRGMRRRHPAGKFGVVLFFL